MFWIDVLFEVIVFLITGLLQIPLDIVSGTIAGLFGA